MANPLPLTEQQEELRDKLKQLLNRVWKLMKMSHPWHSGEEAEKAEQELPSAMDQMAQTAHELHQSLAASGYPPKHHGYMIENRGMPADDAEFYFHVHPVEDLLKFLEDPGANDDPQDLTVGCEFTLRIAVARFGGQTDQYRLIRTDSGWIVKHIAIGGPCDKGRIPSVLIASGMIRFSIRPNLENGSNFCGTEQPALA